MHRDGRTFALVALLVTATACGLVLSQGGSRLASLFAPAPPTRGRRLPLRDVATTSRRARHVVASAHSARAHSTSSGLLSLATALRIAAVDFLASLAALIAAAMLLIKGRIDARERRDYALFEIHLSMHDDAKPRDVKDMVESLAAAVREWPIDRARDGQPFFAVELHYGSGPSGMEFVIALRCERDLAGTLQAIIANAYPDVRVGQVDGGDPQPVRGRLHVPGHVLRFRKERAFVYPLAARETEVDASPALEAVAQTQAMAGTPSSVRLQFTPAPLVMEAWARRKFRSLENRLARGERSGGPAQAGLRSVLHQEEMRSANRAQDSSMFWFEIQVAAATAEHANRIAASLIARRGENRLQRRRMVVRGDLYRTRFPQAYPPLVPSIGFGRFPSLASASEIAHLLTLPTARMKAVPVRRLTVPRLPPPPEIARTDDVPVRLPEPGSSELTLHVASRPDAAPEE
jgi:hypothetical protein